MVDILKFETSTCPICKQIAPILEQISKDYNDVIKVKVINVENNLAMAKEFNARVFPTLVFMKDGKEFDRIIGFTNKKTIMEKILL